MRERASAMSRRFEANALNPRAGGQQPPGFVAAKDEVLKVQSALGGTDHLHSNQEPVDAERNDAKSGISAMFACRALKLPAEARFFRMSERHGPDQWPSVGVACSARYFDSKISRGSGLLNR
jgi:hypothetical protein